MCLWDDRVLKADRLSSMKKKVNSPEDQFWTDIQMKQF